MHTFTDTNAREWTIPPVTLATIRRVRDAKIGVNLADPAETLFAQLEADPLALCDTLAAILGVPPADFAQVMDGNTLANARRALQAAVIAFQPTAARPALQALVDAAERFEAGQVAQAMERFTDGTVDRAIAAAFEN